MADPLHVELPQSDDAERSVLGAVLVENSYLDEVADLLRAEDFYRTAHQRVYSAMLQMAEEALPVDLLTLAARLHGDGVVEAAGGPAFLSRLMDGIPKLVNVKYYAEIVRERSVRRQLIHAANALVQRATSGEAGIEEVLDSAERSIFSIAEQRKSMDFQEMARLLEKSMDHVEQRQKAGGALTGVPTGFSAFDELTSGLQASDLVIVAARPSMGKTAWALSAAQNAAVRQGLKVAIFSLEMAAEQLALRMLCSEARVNAQQVRKGELTDRHWQKLIAAYQRLREARIFVDDQTSIAVPEMRAKCRRLKADKGLDLIIVDYLQLVGSTGRSENRQQEISAISRGLKDLAREMAVPVVALSQLSRAPDQRTGDHRPQLSDLRESGCLSGDSLVTLADSGERVPIRELEGRAGFRVLALDEETCRLVPSVVSRAFATGRKPVFRLRTALGREIRATGNHQFRTFSGWTRLDEIGLDTHVALPRIVAPESRQTMRDEELALLGHLIGDGCTLPRHVLQYTTREEDLARLVSELVQTLFPTSIAPRVVRERRWFQVYLTSTRHHTHGVRNAVAEWLSGLGVFGLRSYEKRVPAMVFSQPPSAVALFLSHLWATDGSMRLRAAKAGRHMPNVFYTSSSERLSRDVASLLLRLGIVSRLARVPQGRKGRDQFTVHVTGKPDVERFLQSVRPVGQYRQSSASDIAEVVRATEHVTNRDVIPAEAWGELVLPALTRSGMTHRQLASALEMAYCGSTLYRQNLSRERAARVAAAVGVDELARLADSDVYWDRVVAIEPDGEDDVYDLTVPGPANFVANDVIVHNSLEQDADVVAFIFREEVYKLREKKDPGDRKGVAEIIIAKQRNGPVDTVELAFIKEWTRFENLERHHRPEGASAGAAAPLPATEAEDRAPF